MNVFSLFCLAAVSLAAGCVTVRGVDAPQPKGDILRESRQPAAFEGTVTKLHPSPKKWCNLAVDLATLQAVAFRIKPAEGAEREVVVFYFLERPPGCTDCQPALAADVFAVGTRHRVQASKTADGDLIAWPKAGDFQRR